MAFPNKVVFLCLLVLFLPALKAQPYDLTRQWLFMGPGGPPENPGELYSSGIGPIEFIRVHPANNQLLLAGSLSGGLFFSQDGAEQWINAGSDRWPYSGCGWADFYPGQEETWFASSNYSDNNGKPGKMGHLGGLYRTFNAGTDWYRIGGPEEFGSSYYAIYGTRFHPENNRILFVMTQEGLYYTQDCLADEVAWNRVPDLGGWIYDLDFVDGKGVISQFQHGKWNIHMLNLESLSPELTIAPVQNMTETMRTITFEPFGENLLVLVDFQQEPDVVYEYVFETGELHERFKNQQVNYGSGHTFAVSPHRPGEFLIGYSTTLKKWDHETGKTIRLGSGYHVDVEFVAYDPRDTARVYVACHGGVYRSDDDGASWQDKSRGLAVAEVMGLDVSMSDPEEIVIGTFHDGSSVRADFDRDGVYTWRAVNGGDALTPLIDPLNAGIVYTSTQFNGGGIYISKDTAQNNSNIHNLNGLGTSGWELSAVLHPVDPQILFFNFAVRSGSGKGNIDIARTPDATLPKSAVVISDFRRTHGLESYKVYGLFNSPAFPDFLYAYVLEYQKDENGKKQVVHRLFRTETARDSADNVIGSWYELQLPYSAWIGDVETHPSDPNRVFVVYTGARDIVSDPMLTTGLVYALRYHKTRHTLLRQKDISRNLPASVAGRFNLVCLPYNGGEMFVATRTGVWYGNAKTLKGRAGWAPVGYGLPHCKIYTLHYHPGKQMLTVGLFGRGVWRYYLAGF